MWSELRGRQERSGGSRQQEKTGADSRAFLCCLIVLLLFLFSVRLWQAEATGCDKASMKAAWKACGDLGDVAMRARSRQQTFCSSTSQLLTVSGGALGVFSTLHAIARESGAGAQARKTAHIKRLAPGSSGGWPR